MTTEQDRHWPGVNDPEWHDNTPTPLEIAYYALNQAVAKKAISNREADTSKAVIKNLLAVAERIAGILEAEEWDSDTLGELASVQQWLDAAVAEAKKQ